MPRHASESTDADQETPAPFVSARWLQQHLHDRDLVILDAGIERDVLPDGTSEYSSGLPVYRAGHIPGAVHADLVAEFSDPTAAVPFTRPTIDQLAAALGRHGVAADSTVLAYDHQNGIWAARLVWVLRSYGFAAAHVLNGGFGTWRAHGGEVQTGDGNPQPTAPPQLVTQPGYFADIDDVRELGPHPTGLVNVLRPEVFSGAEAPYGRAGHIPGSVNLPYADLIVGETDIDVERARRAAASLPPGPIVTYCGSGITASGYALALRASGRTDVRVYDGSMSEWAADPGNPLTTTP